MNLFRRELKTGLKPFFFWWLGLFALIFAGIVKSSGAMSNGAFMTELIGRFPRIVVAVMGMANVDISNFGGFYAVIMQYAFVLFAVYAAHLGSAAVSRESVDRTYEFLFTKPRSRSFILAGKLLAAVVFLTVFAAFDLLFSMLAVRQIDVAGDFTGLFARFALAAWFIGLVFFSLSAMLAASFRQSERGAKAGNLAVLAAYALAVVYDLLEHPGALRLLTPFRYFLNAEIVELTFNLWFAGLSALLAAAFFAVAFFRFERRDLGAL
jgi:ABC-2 type transport system permease protein